MMRRFSTALALAIGFALPAQADPTIGFGVSIAFGGGVTETGIGLRIFSDDEPETAVGSVGLDYMFQSGRVRPTVGVAYLDEDFYVGLDVGYDIARGGVDFGVSAGGVNTDDDSPSDMDVDDPMDGPTEENGDPIETMLQ